MSFLEVKVVTNEIEFEQLKQQWNSLLEECQVQEITLTWEWLYTWWSIFKEKRQLWLIVICENNKVVGIAPFLRRTIKYLGLLTIKRIEMLGTGEDEADEICSDYLDFIVEKDKEEEVTREIFNYLINHRSEWDELLLCDIIQDSINFKYFLRHCKNYMNLSINISRFTPCPYIELPEEWELFLKSKQNARRNIKRKSKLLEQEGSVEYITVTGISEFKKPFEIMMSLHQQRWQSENKPGCFASKKFTDFHKKIIALFLPEQKAMMYFMKVNDKYIACQYCFSYGNKLYGYLKGIDVSFSTKLSPGFLLTAFCLQNAIMLGKKEYDFFKGKKNSHKYEWTDKERSVFSVRIVLCRGIKNSIYILLGNLRETLKAMLGRKYE